MDKKRIEEDVEVTNKVNRVKRLARAAYKYIKPKKEEIPDE